MVTSDDGILFTAVDGVQRAVDATGDTPQLLSSLSLEGGDAQLLEHDGRVVAVRGVRPGQPDPAPAHQPGPGVVVGRRVQPARVPVLGATSLAVVPVGEPSFTGALGFEVTRDGIAPAGRVTHTGAAGDPVAIDRSAVVGDRLLTVSSAGVQASTLDGLAPLGWLAFPGAAGGDGAGGAQLPMGR